MLPAIVQGQNNQRSRDRAMELISLVGLADFTRSYPNELSGGMEQRAALARALLNDPAMLLMDEPFGALDAMTREQMNLELLKVWSSARKTVLLITHSISEAVFLGDRVLVLSARPGRLVADLPVDLPRPRTTQTYSHPEFSRLAQEIRQSLGLAEGHT
jgi:NitT/TauT family transport system ATP-binding protein